MRCRALCSAGVASILTALLALQAFPAALALPAFYLILLRLGLLNSHWA